ncbi:MAG: hypothetical protein R2734_14530 [Nocardioides sp.]
MITGSTAVHSRSARALRAPLALLSALMLVLLGTGPLAGAAHADPVVSPVPGKSPGVLDGEVYALAKVGGTVVVGGSFTQASSWGSSTVETRSRILTYDAATGELVSGFAPVLDGTVYSIQPGPVPNSVLVAGTFKRLNDKSVGRLVLLDLATGNRVKSFKAASINGRINSLAVAGNRLYVGGNFTKVGGVAHAGFASLDFTTGVLDPFVNVQASDWRNDSGSGAKSAVGVHRARRDAERRPGGADRQLQAGGRAAARPGGHTRRPARARWCPDLGDDPVLAVLREERLRLLGARRQLQPRRLVLRHRDRQRLRRHPVRQRLALGDLRVGLRHRAQLGRAGPVATRCGASRSPTTWSAVGGHMRWMNNSNGRDAARQGAVPRPGIAALSVQNGMPLDWNPGRHPRGEAVLIAWPPTTGCTSAAAASGGQLQYLRPGWASSPTSVATRSPTTREPSCRPTSWSAHPATWATRCGSSPSTGPRSARRQRSPPAWRGGAPGVRCFIGSKVFYGNSDAGCTAAPTTRARSARR